MKLHLTLASLAGAGLFATAWIVASDHREAPLIQEDVAADVADLYFFESPTDPNNVVLAMTVNPFTAPSENNTYHFSPDVRYSFLVDNDGDAVENETVHVTFSDRGATGQTQSFTVELGDGTTFTGDVTMPTVEASPNAEIVVQGPNGITAFAGPREDPFYFDVVGFNRFLAGTGGFTGADGFAGYNVSAIVVEMPLCELGCAPGQTLQVWAETARRKARVLRSEAGNLRKTTGPWEQVDRVGNPAVSTALIPFDLKDVYNLGEPVNDAADFAGAIVASLQALGTSQANIDVLASVAVPDTLKYDPAQPTAYPNGRAPADDVVDVLFSLIFNQTGVTDLVPANDAVFPAAFPYLAAPFQP